MSTRRATAAVGAGWIAAIVLAVGWWWAVGFSVVQFVAASGYAAAVAEHRATVDDYSGTQGSADATLARSSELGALASQLVAAVEGSSATIAKEAPAELTAALDAVRTTAASIAALPEPPATLAYAPDTAALDTAAAAVRAESATLRAADLELQALTERLTGELAGVESAAGALFTAAVAQEDAILASGWLSSGAARAALIRAATALDGAALDSAGVAAFRDFVTSADAVAASQSAEVASFAGPLSDARLAVAQYAGSISGGVLLQFDWAPELYGYGESNGGIAGNATIESDGEVDFSTITLTDTVAERWGDGRAEAIVTHEVGHAITGKCWDLFQQVANGDYEGFATAWAIGMGWDNPSNGTAAYGRPSDALIEAALACR